MYEAGPRIIYLVSTISGKGHSLSPRTVHLSILIAKIFIIGSKLDSRTHIISLNPPNINPTPHCPPFLAMQRESDVSHLAIAQQPLPP